ncbi:lipid II flippase MurJ [Acinetobacter bereziniae]|uniref:lipid II flippase MurJ n=1 Tax=Acinetobacter bereziniae TaxID=106648 RepID=UPI0032B3F5F3
MYKKSIILFLLKLLKVPLAILTLSLTAKYFGVSLDKDVWLIGSMIIGMLGLAVWGPINETFRAKFVVIKESEGQETAISYTKSLLFYMFSISCIIMILIFIYPQLIAEIIAPGFSGLELEKLVQMIRFLVPIFLLSQLNLILSSILNAYEVYYIPEISSLCTQIINIFLIIFFAQSMGIQALIVALYISTLVLSIFLISKIVRLKIPLFTHPIVFKFDGFKLFFIFALPFFLPYFIGQLNGIVEKAVATSIGVGAVSIVDFARRIPDLLNSVLISIILTILVPTLTKAFVNHDAITYSKEFLESYRLGLFGLILFIVFFINGAEPVSYLLYKSPSINTEQMNSIILLSKLFAISLIGVFSYIIFGMSMLSADKAKLYVISGSFAQILVTIVNLIMVKWFDMKVFPLSFFLAHFLAAFYMLMHYPYDKLIIYKETIRYYLLGIISASFAYLIYSSYKLSFGSNLVINQFFNIFYSFFLTIILVFLVGAILKITEIHLLFQLIRFNFMKGRSK